MRTLLLATVLSLPAFGQVWLPDGTQIRTSVPERPSPWRIALGNALRARTHNPMTHQPFHCMPSLGQPADGSPEYLERVEPSGTHAWLATPDFLELQKGSLVFWEGAAYAVGHRRHPAVARVVQTPPSNPGPFPSPRTDPRPTEVWICRDFKTWEPFARLDVKDPHWKSGGAWVTKGPNFQVFDPQAKAEKANDEWVNLCLPLAGDRLLARITWDPSGRGFMRIQREVAVLRRRQDGGLVWERNLKIPDMALFRRSPKGIVALDGFWKVGHYLVLDTGDARLLREGRLELEGTDNRILAALVRPDGNLLIVAGRDPWDSFNAPSSTASSPAQVTPSSYMAMSLVNQMYQSGKRQRPDTTRFQWIVLDPATGAQTRIQPPAGFPREIFEGMRDLHFQDSQNLGW